MHKRGQLGKYEVCSHRALLFSIHEEIKRIFQELLLGAEVEREREHMRAHFKFTPLDRKSVV